jgi:hypothetical protein
VLDQGARTRADDLVQAGVCTFEVQAPARPPRETTTVAEARTGVGEPTWIGIRVFDQYGRVLPWLRARTHGAGESTLVRDLDKNGAARLYPLPTTETCTVEVIGPAGVVEVAT